MADIKNNHFKGKIRDNGLDADIKDISVGNQDVFNNLSFTGYSLTQEIPVAGKILRSDGSDVIKWDDDIRVVNTTYTALTNLINTSGLYPGSIYRFRYYISYPDQTNPSNLNKKFNPASYFDIYLQALTTNTISEDGVRVMRVPKRSYYYKSFVSKGLWESGETYAIDDIVIFAGRVYRNQTGNTGTVTYQIFLDTTNWFEIENTNPSTFDFIVSARQYYEEKVYKIRYDFSKQLVTEQKDELGNTVTGIKDPERRLSSLQNTIELNDWNYPRIFNNSTQGIWGNQTQIITNATFPDFDYAVIKYIWVTGNGTDLDTRTAMVDLPDPLYNQIDIGWARNGNGSMPGGGVYVGPSTSNYYMWWSGDFQGTSGNEATLIDFIRLESSYPTLDELTIRIRAFWYGNRLNGDMQVNITTYKGGTMSKSGFNFVNTGGTLVSNITETYNMAISASANIDGEEIGTLTFDFATNTGFSLINNISEAFIKENNIPGTIHLNDNRRDDEVIPTSYKSIKYNTNKGSIYSNTNKGNIEYNDNLGNINNNTGSYQYILDENDNPVISSIDGITEIEYNSNHGNISSNELCGLGKISYNSNQGNISSNSLSVQFTLFTPNVFIERNINRGDISSNTYSFFGIGNFSSSLGIIQNTNSGGISSNTLNYIGYNSNQGTIESNAPKVLSGFDGDNYGSILYNKNNGNITSNALFAIQSNSNDGFITNNTDPGAFSQFIINEVTEGDNITGLSLSSNYTGYNFPQLIGTVDYILKSDGTNAVWAAASGGGTVTGTGASPQVTLWSATSTVTGSPRITYVDNVGTEVGFRFDDGVNNLTQIGVTYLNIESEGIASNSVTRLANWADNTNKGIVSFRKSRGTKASPTQVLNGDSLGDIIYAGQTNFGTGSTTGVIRLEAKENYVLTFDGITTYTRNALTELGVYLAPSVTTHTSSSGIPNNLVFKVNGDGSVSFKNYTFPTPDGANGQTLTTNGSGTVSWTTPLTGTGASPQVALWTGTTTIGGSSRITYADSPGSDVSINFYDSGYGASYGAGLADIYTEDGPVSVRIRNGALATTTGPLIQFFRSKGDLGSTSPLTSGYVLGELDFFGTYDVLGNYNGSAAIRVEASQTWTNTANGTKVSIVTMANGEYTGLTERFAVIGTGAIRFNDAYTFPMTAGSPGQVLTTNGFGTLSWTTVSGGGGSSGSGTLNYVSKWTPDSTTLGDSRIFDNGTIVAINSANPTGILGVTLAIEETVKDKISVSIDYLSSDVSGTLATGLSVRSAYSVTTTSTNSVTTGVDIISYGGRAWNIGVNSQLGVFSTSPDSILTSPGNLGFRAYMGSNSGATNPTNIGSLVEFANNISSSGSSIGYYASVNNIGAGEKIGYYSKLYAVGTGNRYSVQFIDGTEDTGKFLKSVTNTGKGNWAYITGADITGGTNGRLAIWGTTLTDSSDFTYEIGTNQSSIIVGTPYSNAVYVSDNGEVSIWKNNTATSFSNGATLNLYTFGSDVNYTSKILLKRNRGTAASTSVILSGDEIGQIQFGPYEGASIRVYATENRLGVNDDTGTSLVIRTVSNGTTNTSAERFRIEGDGAIKVTGQIYSALPSSLAPTGTTQAINWNDGNGQMLSLASATGNVTLTFTNPKAGAVYVLKVTQHATSFKNIVWPAAVKWSGGVLPTISAVANAVDTVVLFYDGTYYYANVSQNYA